MKMYPNQIKNSFVVLLLAMTVSIFYPQHVIAATSDTSANVVGDQEGSLPIAPKQEDKRIPILQKFLATHDSPLSDYSDVFIKEADANNLDWKLLPAIAGVESTFGLNIPANSYNGWGFGIYGNNSRRFASWNEAIGIIAKSLRDDYMDKWGAKDIYGIGRIYAADPGWAYKVSHFMSQLDEFAANQPEQDKTLSISL